MDGPAGKDPLLTHYTDAETKSRDYGSGHLHTARQRAMGVRSGFTGSPGPSVEPCGVSCVTFREYWTSLDLNWDSGVAGDWSLASSRLLGTTHQSWARCSVFLKAGCAHHLVVM